MRTFTTRNLDGNYYCEQPCKRCGSPIYIYALRNSIGISWEENNFCPWCRGECSAAEMDHNNAELATGWRDVYAIYAARASGKAWHLQSDVLEL